MPGLTYLSMRNREIVSEPWQVWVLFGVVAFLIGFLIWAIIESKNG